jgi:hypothetical protein
MNNWLSKTVCCYKAMNLSVGKSIAYSMNMSLQNVPSSWNAYSVKLRFQRIPLGCNV